MEFEGRILQGIRQEGSKEGPIPRISTVFESLPAMMNPPIATLSPDLVSSRVEMLSNRVGGVRRRCWSGCCSRLGSGLTWELALASEFLLAWVVEYLGLESPLAWGLRWESGLE